MPDENEVEDERRYDHRQIVRPGVAAVRAAAAPRFRMHAVPIQSSAMVHMTTRKGIGKNKPTSSAAWGIQHANTLLDVLASQSREA